MEHGFTLHVVHITGTRMIAQGTDGLSRGILLEGVVRGEDMLSFIDIARTALERHPGLLDYVKSWVDPVLGTSKVLTTKEWFQEGHEITGGKEESKGVWIPRHVADGKSYIFGALTYHCGRRARGMRQGHTQKNGCLPYFLDTPTLLPPLVANVLQTVRFCFQTPTWLTALAILHAQTSLCWYLSPPSHQEPLVSARNAIVGGPGKATAPSAQLL